MSPRRYRVSNSQKVADEFRTVLESAAQQGRLEPVLRAVGKILTALELIPDEFGESKGVLPAHGAVLRRGIVEPLTVEFAVFEDQQQVFIRSFRLWRPGRRNRPSG
jgi:hypothetical protein